MTNRHDEELLQADLDGMLTPGEDQWLRRHLEASADFRQRASELETLQRLLSELGDADPPAELVGHVMARVGPHAGAFGQTGAVRFIGGARMGKKVAMLALAAAAVVLLAVYTIKTGSKIDNAQGTIGAAKRYNAEQLRDADVKVGDTSAQEFLQSDAFDRLIKDPNAVKLLSDPGFRGALGDPAIARAFSDPSVAKAFAALGGAGGPALAQSLSRSDFRLAVADPSFAASLMQLHGSISGADLVAALDKAGLKGALNDNALLRSLNDPALVAALTNAGFLHAISDPQIARAFASPAFGQAIGNPGFAGALADGRLGAALAGSAFSGALANPGFVNAVNSASFGRALAGAATGSQGFSGGR